MKQTAQGRLRTAGATLARIGTGALLAGMCAAILALPFAMAHDMRAAESGRVVCEVQP